MGFAITYKAVIELNLWHHFWLDTDADDFALPPGPATPDGVVRRILDYDLRELLRIRPTEESQQYLASRGLTFKQTTTGCFVVSKNSYTEPNTSFRISLVVDLVDPTWLDYANIGLTSLNRRIFHLSNFGETAVARFLLTSGGNDSLQSTHFVPRKGRVVRLQQLNPGTATTIEVFDALSSSATPVLSFSFPAIANQTEYELDCRSLSEGLYNFVSSNNNIDTTIDPSPQYLGLENQPAAIGVVDLFISGWEETIYDIRLAKY